MLILADYNLFFFFQAEDGIRDADVTGVQTCALPISQAPRSSNAWRMAVTWPLTKRWSIWALLAVVISSTVAAPVTENGTNSPWQIGRASCRKECRYRWSPYH